MYNAHFIFKYRHVLMVNFQDVIGKEVKVLLALKEQYQAIAGKAWQPCATPAVASSAPSVCAGNQAEALLAKIDAQGVNVRQLKSSGASKVVVWSLFVLCQMRPCCPLTIQIFKNFGTVVEFVKKRTYADFYCHWSSHWFLRFGSVKIGKKTFLQYRANFKRL